MTAEFAVRLADVLLALLFGWLLIVTLAAGRIGGRGGYRANRAERPGQYWFGVFLFALMVLHFGGLAWIGQKLG